MFYDFKNKNVIQYIWHIVVFELLASKVQTKQFSKIFSFQLTIRIGISTSLQSLHEKVEKLIKETSKQIGDEKSELSFFIKKNSLLCSHHKKVKHESTI